MTQLELEQNNKVSKFVVELQRTDTSDVGRKVFVKTGRKYDKVYVDDEIRYFIAKYTKDEVSLGDIFGAKSDVAPNYKWYFGNIDNLDKWDWSGYHGVPVCDSTVECGKTYGIYKHYKKVTKK